MTNDPQLDSASAVEVAAFCWPKTDPQQAWETLMDDGAISPNGYESDVFGFRNWDDLHRAAAVLAERGHGLKISGFMVDEWRLSQAKIHYQDWFLAAPADAWARAILATVREVSK